jgi:hypothetical protein
MLPLHLLKTCDNKHRLTECNIPEEKTSHMQICSVWLLKDIQLSVQNFPHDRLHSLRTTLEDMDSQLYNFLYIKSSYIVECANFVLIWLKNSKFEVSFYLDILNLYLVTKYTLLTNNVIL